MTEVGYKQYFKCSLMTDEHTGEVPVSEAG
jgi:hypothetical protein